MRELQPADVQVLGPYRLLGLLGGGGMGQVFLGLSAGGRLVAVKVIRAELAADPEFRIRFRREIAAARKVSGLFTAAVVDADVDGPIPWLATAYVPGPSLAQAVTEHGPLPAASVLALAAGVLMVDGWQHGSGNFAEAVVFNPATGQWSEAARPILPRSGADATLLPDGNVLVCQGGQRQCEIYDPATNTWSLAATALGENNGGQAFLLPDGQVLLAGGDARQGPSTTAELYTRT